MTIYIDISQLERARSNTGIQRVLKEFLQRIILEKSVLEVKVISHNSATNTIELLENSEITLFLNDIKHYQFQSREPIDIENSKVVGKNIFFDIDSVWSVALKREKLYPKLKANGFLIFNFLYDLVPIVMPHVAHEVTVMNFEPFLEAVYKYSDMVFFDSHSCKRDFLEVKASRGISRNIPSRVLGLGSDFSKVKNKINIAQTADILAKKYILFVGTIEPRKNQKEMLDAFEVLSEKYADLNFVIIGQEGWNVKKLINRINNHPLKDTKLHWLSNIDDNQLKEFYKNAFIVTYLSKYEGYGLPIVESLQFGNITITSKNSSMLEAGRDFADYIIYNTKNEIVEMISLYCDNPALYYAKKSYIKEHFKTLSWDTVYDSLLTVFKNHEKSENLRELQKKSHTKELQFIFISISFESIEETIKQIDRYMGFVKEYIVVTQPKLVDKFKTLTTSKKLTIVDETEILKGYKKDFHLRDHQSKNWLLRVSLLNLEILDDEFIMLDDDNRPLKEIPIEFFISKDGCYNAYYFYNLLEWNHKGTAYDIGQHSTNSVLTSKNYELLSYSSHAPQILNRQILEEVASIFFEIGLNQPIDEWSIYFNYAISHYPSLFSQNIFQTLNWPDSPHSWDYSFIPTGYSFENYYEKVYNNKVFNKETTYQEKVEIKNREITPYTNSQKLFQKNIPMLSGQNMAHGLLSFKKQEIEFYLFGVPYLIIVEESSAIRLKINYKLLNPNEELHTIVIAILLFGKPRTYIKLQGLNTKSYQEGIVELPIVTQNLSSIVDEYPLASEILKEGMHNISFDVMINKEYIYGTNSPYLTKLMIVDREKMTNYLNHKEKKTKKSLSLKNSIRKEQLKEFVKAIPLIGWFSRWSNNILRLNRLVAQHHWLAQEYTQHSHSYHHTVDTLLEKIEQQQQQIDTLLQKKNQMEFQVSHEVSKQSLLFQESINAFATQNQERSEIKKEQLQKATHNFVLDNFYLAFENQFRGDTVEIEARYKSYLKYLNSDIKTALDIGCGRAEWVGLLQKNGIQAEGIDLNFSMLNEGTNRGVLNLQKIDAFDFFKTCPDNSFDLVTAFHIIEHIPYEKLFIFLQEIKRISTPNATILLETPNPANLLVAAFEFYKDPTHLNPLPADVMKFTVEYMGFSEVRVEKLHPFPEKMNIEEHSQTAQVVNHYLYQERDYLIIAKNPKELKETNPKKKTKLAFISPLPPQQSGIAYYSAELLLALSEYYEIETISDFEWFKTHHNEYARVLYHFGNSAFHIEMLELLEITSGVVVLHDFHLKNLLYQAKKLTPSFRYKEYGYKSLLIDNNYPYNQTIINQAIGVIVHSEYSKNMLKDWYHTGTEELNANILTNWSTIPHLRTPPKIDEPLLSKEMLGLPKDSFVVCSFGLLRPNKKNLELVEAWLNSTLNQNPNCYLIFVGDNQIETEYGKKLESATSNTIRITNWVDEKRFKSYLTISDIAVQLRSNSVGETSGTILDCMNHEIPLIINANGSNQEIPKDTLIMLEDNFTTKELTQSLEHLYTNQTTRNQLATKAKEHIRRDHTPKICAKLYHESIEKQYKHRDAYKISEIKKAKNILKKEALAPNIIETLQYSNFEPIRQKQILVDVSTIIRKDLKTGIERVVRSQIIEMVKNAPAHIRIEPVYLSTNSDNPNYFYAREYTKNLLSLTSITLKDEPVKVNRGDVFYGLDLCVKEVEIATKTKLYQHYKALGVKISFVVYDLLPITHPQFFPDRMEEIHKQWFENITGVADQLISISDKVAKEVTSHLDIFGAKASDSINITSLHLGADLETKASAPKRTKPNPSTPITFLMVGTVEPRKAHQEVLNAFEKLWEQGENVKLKIVGKEGWGMERFIKQLKQHPQQHKKLFYLDFVEDKELHHLYATSHCLIVASYDEGFGLPIIEGAKYNIPIIARDIEIFREVAGEYAHYFKEDKLDLSIKEWSKLYQEKKHPLSKSMPYLTWKENAKKLLERL